MSTPEDQPIAYPVPGPGTRSRRVWEIADAVTEETGRRAERREVVDRFVAENGNRNTATTQYQHWKANHDAHDASVRTERQSGDAGPQALKVAPDGRLVIPQEMRLAMRLGDDDRVTARVVRGELRLVSRAVALGRMQAEARQYKKPGESVVDAFLAERRGLWGSE